MGRLAAVCSTVQVSHVIPYAAQFVECPGSAAHVQRSVRLHHAGKTTTLLELVPQLRELLEEEPELAMSIIRDACNTESTPEDHEKTFERLKGSIAEDMELVSWIRYLYGRGHPT